jgi:hypothetical protein
MNDISDEEIEKILKRRKGVEYCAKRLGITPNAWRRIRKDYKARKRGYIPDSEIRVEFNKNEATYHKQVTEEPKSPEDIIRILNIDTSVWKLSQYWNKQQNNTWRISALVTKIKKSESDIYLEDLIKNWKPKKHKIPKVKHDSTKELVCGIMSLQDIHFGKEGNDTIDKDFEDAVIDLITRATKVHFIKDLYFVIGGDLINMDTFTGTTTSGTSIDNSMKPTEAYMEAFNAMHWAIHFLKDHCKTLTVVYIPGNHDRLTSFHLAHALSRSIDCPDIIWDISYQERKVHVWHDNFNAFEHGDSISKNTPLVYASEFPLKWGSTKNRTLFTGHFHSNRKVEYVTTNENVGFIHKTLPSLSKTDYWHYHKKFVGNRRSGKIELQSPTKGNICEMTYLAD